jgi:AcrR family transcriptional regulator
VVTRKYELKKRAESQEATRQRIVEAAMELHVSVGPHDTTISAIAERAGVQRQTVYRHFPEDRDLQLACSGLYQERHPFPDPEPLAGIAGADARLRRAAEQLYAYYEDNEQLLTNVVRDMERHELTREIAELRIGPLLARHGELSAAAFGARGRRRDRVRAAVDVALSFRTWQALRGHGLSQAEAVDAAVGMARCQ